MSIQRKIFATLILAIGLSFSVLYITIRHITVSGHIDIENKLVKRNVQRVEESLNGLVEQLGIKSSDWGNWDDTYKFIQDHNQAYIESNLGDNSLKNIHINFMLFIDNAQNLVLAKSISDMSWTEVNPTDDIVKLAKPESELLQDPDNPNEKGGLLVIDRKPAVIFTRPIRNSDGTSPSKGTLIWGYFITPDIIEDIKKKTHLDINFELLEDALHDKEHPIDAAIQTIILDNNKIEGYTTFNDIYGKKAFYFEVFQMRPVYEEGLKSAHYLGFVLIGSMVIFAIFLYTLLNQVIISRMICINRDLEKIIKSENKYMRVRPLGDDEIGKLSDKINHTLEALEKSHSTLESTQQQLIESQKLESLGKLAGGIAHDFNNILGSILGYASLLQSKLSQDPNISKKLAVIIQSAERGAHLTQQLLGFAKRGKYEKSVFSLNELVDECITLMRSSSKHITIEKILDTTARPLEGDPTQVLQVLLNLGLNANEAMSTEGGKLYFGTQSTDLDELALKSLGAPPHIKPGTYILLTVRDTGIGIPKSIQGKIFEPFFTTKGAAKGSGLGLATTHGIVENHDGWITFNSEEGRGTTFHVFFPVSHQECSPSPLKITLDNVDLSLLENKTILITDDEKNMRDYVSDILLSYKTHIITAENGKDGAEKFDKYQVDLVILDLIMPQYDGFYAYEEIHKSNPETPILFVSGYSEDSKVAEIRAKSKGKVYFIQKPYKPEKLLLTLAAIFKERKNSNAAA